MGESNGTVWLPEQASTLAPEIDWLFYFVYWTSVVLFVLVVAAMLYFAYRYRRQSAADRPAPVEQSLLMEASWVVIPTILVLLVFNWGFKTFIEIGVAPPDSYEIQVSGQQWAWTFTYPNGYTTDELHVPVDRPVKLNMNSTDVIHSFFVPAFRVKQDVLPHRYTSLWFEATKEGTYQAFCTEYCGTQHSGMDAMVVVHNQDGFEDWLSGSASQAENMSLPEYGELLYTQQGCNVCHSLDGSRLVGPTWQGLYGTEGHPMSDGSTVTVDENYLREAILEPGVQLVAGYGNQMPASYGSTLSDRQTTALIAFIKMQSEAGRAEIEAGGGAAAGTDSAGAAADSAGAASDSAGATEAEQASAEQARTE